MTLFEKYLNLIKPMLPSWKFYDDYSETIMLFYRSDVSDIWKPLYRTPKTSLKALFINDQGNMPLAIHSHIGQLLNDIEKHDGQIPFEQTLSYKLTVNMVQAVIGHGKKFQFKLASVSKKGIIEEDILLSPFYEGDV